MDLLPSKTIEKTCTMVKTAEKVGTKPDVVILCTEWGIPPEKGWGGLRNAAGRLYARYLEYDSATRSRLLWLHRKFTAYIFCMINERDIKK